MYWGLNPGPSTLEASTLPLGYRGAYPGYNYALCSLYQVISISFKEFNWFGVETIYGRNNNIFGNKKAAISLSRLGYPHKWVCTKVDTNNWRQNIKQPGTTCVRTHILTVMQEAAFYRGVFNVKASVLLYLWYF